MKLLCTWQLNDEHKQTLKTTLGNESTVTFVPENQVSENDVTDAEIIWGNVPASFLKNANHLKWMQLGTAGVDAYIVPGVFPKNALLTNATGAYGKSVSEHAFACLLMLMKNLHLYRDNQAQKEWKDEGDVSSLDGKTILIVGFGDIGKYFSRLCKPFGSHIIGVKKHAPCDEDFSAANEVYTFEKLETLLPRADIVFSVVPNTPETLDMWNKNRFSLMKESAFFINVGRGSSVNEDDLVNALNSKKIKGAAIDVTKVEPLPKDSPLWSTRNLILTPHSAGSYHLKETVSFIFNIALNNLTRYLKGQKLVNEIDFELGYAKN